MHSRLKIKKQLKSRLLARLLRYEKISDYPYRKYFLAHQCIFIHIPKNAGTSVLSSLAGHHFHRDHCTYREYQAANPELFIKYFKFCFSRNPLDRLASVYRYLSLGGNKDDDLYFTNKIHDTFTTFDRFVVEYLDENIIHEHRLFMPQYLYVFDHTGKLMVDFVGKFENIDEDYQHIARKVGLHEALPKRNITPGRKRGHSELFTNPEVLEKVVRLYEKDFALFGYTPSFP